MLPVPLVRLQCGVNSYEWGKIGSNSAAAKYAAATPAEGFTVQEDKPYAELWMGTHPSNPSRDVASGKTLLELVSENRGLLSAPVAERFGEKLPFLFKILSINKALSIQAHPNKKLAEVLHARDPAHYPDDNHKPEMAIAVTPFEGLCGFRPLAEIAAFLENVAPFRKLVGEEKAVAFIANAKAQPEEPSEEQAAESKKQLQAIFGAAMATSTDASVLEPLTKELLELATSRGAEFAAGGVPSTSGAVLSELITRTHGEFGVDIGIFVLFFLNFVTLEPGEALFLVADDIHAYVSGDIVECMAASDNVVRAGFTPKFKDVSTLVDMLTYNFAPIDEQKMVPTDYPYATLNATGYSSASSVKLYNPPIDEFAVVRSKLNGNKSKATFDPIEGPSIIICTSGKGKISVGGKSEVVEAGYVFFVGADDDTGWERCDEAAEDGDGTANTSLAGAGSDMFSGIGTLRLDEDNNIPSHGLDLEIHDPASLIAGSGIQCYYNSFEEYERQASSIVPSAQLPMDKTRYHQFMQIPNEDIVDELTRMDWVMFCSIRIRDFVRHVSASKEAKAKSKSLQNVQRMISHFNHVARWVSNMTLLRDKPKHRAQILDKFIDIAHKLRARNNYNGLAAVLAGLNSTSVHRLAQTKALLTAEALKQLAMLTLLMATQKSHFAYRLAWENSSLPRIPFIPLHLRDLVSAEEGNPTFVPEDGSPVDPASPVSEDFINWGKFDILGDILLPIMRSQGTEYAVLRRSDTAHELILDCRMPTDEDEIYARSLEVESAVGGQTGMVAKKFPWFAK